MTYFDKLLEFMGNDAKKAAKMAFTNCPKDFFDGAPKACADDDIGLITCRNCWFSEVKEEE